MSDCTLQIGGSYTLDAPGERINSGNMSIPAVVVRSLTTQARSQKVPSANHVRQLQSFHCHIARLATGRLFVSVAVRENIASRSGSTRGRPAFEIPPPAGWTEFP